MSRPDTKFTHAWHVAINQFNWPRDGKPPAGERHWMYEAKTMADEVPRLMTLFRMERTGQLTPLHQQCSHAPTEPVVDNHLTCCLGMECRACPELKALEAMEGRTAEEIDTAKAWTCAAHIVSKGGDLAGEGYVLTTDDRMYWDRLYRNLAMPNPDEDTSDGESKSAL